MDTLSLSRFIIQSREKFIAYFQRRYNMRIEDAEDLFQESCMALHNNINNGSLSQLSCSAFTYILSIGINKANKKSKKKVELEFIETYEPYIDLNFESSPENSIQKETIIAECVNMALRSDCRDILWGYYRDGLSMTDLAALLNLRNAETAKTTKSRCMKKLKEKIIETFKTHNLL